MSSPLRGDTHWLRSSIAGDPIPAPSTSSSARGSSRILRDQSGVRRQNLLLVSDDRFLIAQNPLLIPNYHWEALLILQKLRLVPDDYPLICDDRLLISERRLCH